MPITTPSEKLAEYNNDVEHFIHVMEHLFIPAIEKAELEPMLPIASGTDVIQAEIIKKLETADLVLCDMSILNPNVFFELGIRTALNKPVCLVKDERLLKIPFDMSIVNHHSYKGSLNAWELQDEIERLSTHLKETIKKNDGSNTLWKYFGLSMRGAPLKEATGVEAKIDYLVRRLDGIQNKTESSHNSDLISREGNSLRAALLASDFKRILEEKMTNFNLQMDDENRMVIIYGISPNQIRINRFILNEFEALFNGVGYKVFYSSKK